MKYSPHEYQTFAQNFVCNHEICAMFFDCGLGKTAISLSAIVRLINEGKVKKVLVIAPKRVALCTWPSEIEKWDHTRGLKYAVAVGPPAKRIDALKSKVDVYIINRENVQWLVEKSGVPFDFDMVVIDELSSFKNHKTHIHRSLMKVRPGVKRIVGLTGTPAPNGLMDLFGEIGILDMGKRLGRFITHFREAYFVPDKYNLNIVYSYKPLPFAEEAIYEKISDICISMRNTELLNMPDLVVSDVECVMGTKEKKMYDELKKNYILPFAEGDIDATSAAALSLKLRQIANGAVYVDKDVDGQNVRTVKAIHDVKLDALEDLIESAYGKPVLVAYWFKHDLSRIKERLEKLDVVFDCLDSVDSIERWNQGMLQVGLIHPASAGHGLNLQKGGSTLIWFGLNWSLELYQQTNARIYRQGQESTVVIQHIVCKGTIDERIIKALEDKGNTQDALIDAVKAEVKGI